MAAPMPKEEEEEEEEERCWSAMEMGDDQQNKK